MKNWTWASDMYLWPRKPTTFWASSPTLLSSDETLFGVLCSALNHSIRRTRTCWSGSRGGHEGDPRTEAVPMLNIVREMPFLTSWLCCVFNAPQNTVFPFVCQDTLLAHAKPCFWPVPTDPLPLRCSPVKHLSVCACVQHYFSHSRCKTWHFPLLNFMQLLAVRTWRFSQQLTIKLWVYAVPCQVL